MNKNKLGAAHIALFVVCIASVGYTATNYIREEMRFRSIMAGAEALRTGAGGKPVGQSGGAGQADGASQAGGASQPGKPGRGIGGGSDPQQMAQRQLEQMSQQLKLTATQKAQIKAIQEKDAPRLKATFDDKSVPANQKWAKMRPLRAATDEAIKKVLTPAQQNQYGAQQAATRAQRGAGGRGGR